MGCVGFCKIICVFLLTKMPSPRRVIRIFKDFLFFFISGPLVWPSGLRGSFVIQNKNYYYYYYRITGCNAVYSNTILLSHYRVRFFAHIIIALQGVMQNIVTPYFHMILVNTVRHGRWLCLEGLEADLSYKSHRPLSDAINSCHVTVDAIVSLENKIALPMKITPWMKPLLAYHPHHVQLR